MEQRGLLREFPLQFALVCCVCDVGCFGLWLIIIMRNVTNPRNISPTCTRRLCRSKPQNQTARQDANEKSGIYHAPNRARLVRQRRHPLARLLGLWTPQHSLVNQPVRTHTSYQLATQNNNIECLAKEKRQERTKPSHAPPTLDGCSTVDYRRYLLARLLRL